MKMVDIIKKGLQYAYTAYVKYRCGAYGNDLKVNGFSRVSGKTFLGNNVNFNGMYIVGCGTVVIGDNFHSGRECQIITQNHNYEGEKIPYDETYICKDVHIEENVWIGNRVIILGGVHIAEGVIVQAGAVVVKDIPKYAIVGGNPAKVFKYRDKAHYEKLKAEGKFH